MFSAIGTVIVGLIVGVIARFLLPGKEALPDGLTGILLTVVVASRVPFSVLSSAEPFGVERIMPPVGSCPLSVP